MTYRSYSSNEIIALKTKVLDLPSIALIDHYLQTNDLPASGYVLELRSMILSQLICKAGFKLSDYPKDVSEGEQKRLEILATRLCRHFLKRKLDRIKQPAQIAFKPDSEILDPHHHLNSIYVRGRKDLLALLPDFNAIYLSLWGTGRDRSLENELREQEGVLTDVQFLGNPPSGGLNNPKTKAQRLNPTVGYIRGENVQNLLKEGMISDYAAAHNGVCACCDMCGPETNDSLKDVQRYIDHTIRHKAKIIRIHIGETIIPAQGRNNVDQLFKLLESKRQSKELVDQIIRLGHGTHMSIEAMKTCSARGYYVEACLSSNKETGILGKRKDYPLGLMMLLDIKVMIGTDGGDFYFTNLKTEYAHAKKNIGHFLTQINLAGPETVRIPSGEELQYQQVSHLFKDIPEAQGWAGSKLITFADLKLIEPLCLQKIRLETLVDNMNVFKTKMFPGHTNKAVLEDGVPQPTPQPQPVPAPGGHAIPFTPPEPMPSPPPIIPNTDPLAALLQEIKDTDWRVGVIFGLFATGITGEIRMIDGQKKRVPYHVALMVDELQLATDKASLGLRIKTLAETALQKYGLGRSEETLAFYQRLAGVVPGAVPSLDAGASPAGGR